MIGTRYSLPIARPFAGVIAAPSRQVYAPPPPPPPPRIIRCESLSDEDDDFILKVLRRKWEPFHLTLPRNEASTAISATLSNNIAELPNGSTIIGKPQRQRPRFGAIADNIVGQETSWPPRHSPAQSTAPAQSSRQIFDILDGNKCIPIVSPRPVIPLGPIHAAFEVRVAATTVTEADFSPMSTATFDQAPDENIPPSSVFTNGAENKANHVDDENSAPEGPVIPAPYHRGKREPFGLLHYGEEASPFQKRVGIAQAEQPSSPVRSESGSDISTGSAKGWARLRPKAPPAIKVVLLADMDMETAGLSNVVAAKSEMAGDAPGAPVISSPPPLPLT